MTLDLKLKVGENCIFGINCASKFCSPTLKVCTKDAVTNPLPKEIKDSAARKLSTIGGACKEPFAEPQSCLTADNGEPLEEWDPSKCGCDPMYLDKMASGAWLCGMPQVQGMKEEDIADAEAVAKADELVNKITGGKALVLDALIQKLVKVNEILVKGVNKRAHMKYPFNKLNQVSNKIVNLYEKREAAAATPALTEEQKAEAAAKKEAEDKQKKNR